MGNHVSGFDEPGSAALAIHLDPLERVRRSLYRGNVFQRCFQVASESQSGLWTPAERAGNLVIDCGPAK